MSAGSHPRDELLHAPAGSRGPAAGRLAVAGCSTAWWRLVARGALRAPGFIRSRRCRGVRRPRRLDGASDRVLLGLAAVILSWCRPSGAWARRAVRTGAAAVVQFAGVLALAVLETPLPRRGAGVRRRWLAAGRWRLGLTCLPGTGGMPAGRAATPHPRRRAGIGPAGLRDARLATRGRPGPLGGAGRRGVPPSPAGAHGQPSRAFFGVMAGDLRPGAYAVLLVTSRRRRSEHYGWPRA